MNTFLVVYVMSLELSLCNKEFCKTMEIFLFCFHEYNIHTESYSAAVY